MVSNVNIARSVQVICLEPAHCVVLSKSVKKRSCLISFVCMNLFSWTLILISSHLFSVINISIAKNMLCDWLVRCRFSQWENNFLNSVFKKEQNINAWVWNIQNSETLTLRQRVFEQSKKTKRESEMSNMHVIVTDASTALVFRTRCRSLNTGTKAKSRTFLYYYYCITISV